MSRWLKVRLNLDRAIALSLLTVTGPLIAILAGLIMRFDRRPAFIAVARIGRNGKPIRMWKLRTMHAQTLDGLALGPSITSRGDERITGIGRWMRALHLDELPQFYNVVRGDMCLLGPRPEAPQYVNQRDPAWQSVLLIPPGVAGPTQMIVAEWEQDHIGNAANPDGYQTKVLPVKLAIDRWYIHNASLRVDALIVYALISSTLRGTSGLAALRRQIFRDVPESRVAQP